MKVYHSTKPIRLRPGRTPHFAAYWQVRQPSEFAPAVWSFRAGVIAEALVDAGLPESWAAVEGRAIVNQILDGRVQPDRAWDLMLAGDPVLRDCFANPKALPISRRGPR